MKKRKCFRLKERKSICTRCHLRNHSSTSRVLSCNKHVKQRYLFVSSHPISSERNEIAGQLPSEDGAVTGEEHRELTEGNALQMSRFKQWKRSRPEYSKGCMCQSAQPSSCNAHTLSHTYNWQTEEFNKSHNDRCLVSSHLLGVIWGGNWINLCVCVCVPVLDQGSGPYDDWS